MKRALLLLAGCVGLAGCSELEPFLPDVTFDKLEINALDFKAADVDFVFQVDNPNPIRLGLSSFSYGLSFADVEIISGDADQGFRLEPDASSPLELPVHLEWADTWELVEATRGLDEVPYGLDGHMGFMVPELGETKLPYDVGGAFPALRTPKLSLKALRAEGVTIAGADLALDIGVDNDHATNLLFENFDFDVKVAGDRLASGSIPNFANVEGAAEETVELPIHIDFLTAGAVLVDVLLGGGELTVGLDADVDVLTPFSDEVVPLKVDLAELLEVGPGR